MENTEVRLKGLIKSREGLRLKPYRCSAGKLTIGYGRNLDDVGITEKEAEMLLDRDIAMAQQDIYTVFGDQIDDFSEGRYMALVDMMFNLGRSRFMGFKKMIAAAKRGDWEEAANQAMDSRWSTQVGQRAIDIERLLREGG